MTDEVDRLLAANDAYTRRPRANIADARPGRRLAVLTCMDARIDVLAALGLQLGDAHVLRNAGGRVTDDVLRSLAVSTHVLGVETVVVIHHTQCGLVGVTDDELRWRTGADLAFAPIDDHTTAIRDDVDMIMKQPYLSSVKLIAGLIYDVADGRLAEVCRRQR